MILWVLTVFNKQILNIITKQQSLGRFQKDVLSISDRSLCRLTLIWKFGFDWPPFVVKRINNNFWNAHKWNLPYRLAVKASGNPIIFLCKDQISKVGKHFLMWKFPSGRRGYSWEFLVGGCRWFSKSSPKNVIFQTRFQTRPLKPIPFFRTGL